MAAFLKLFLVLLFNLVPFEKFLRVFNKSALVERGQPPEIINHLNKAPEQVVNAEKERCAKLEELVTKLEEQLKEM